MDNKMYKTLLESMGVGVYFVTLKGEITYWNTGAEKITGYSAEEVYGRRCSDNLLRHVAPDGTELCIAGCPLHDTLKDGKQRFSNVYLHHKDGHRVAVNVQIAPIFSEENTIIGAVEVFTESMPSVDQLRDIDTLRQQAFNDGLTNIGNRKFAEMTIKTNHMMFEDNEIPYGALMIDIDRFSIANDKYGQKTGDKILRMVANSLQQGLRGMDTICRWGGEEFLAILPGISHATLESVAERLRFLVSKSWVHDKDEKVTVTVSVGGSIIRPGEEAHTLIERADLLMYKAKEAGRDRVMVE